MSWKEYGLSRQEACEILCRHIAGRESLALDEHRCQVEFTVLRVPATGGIAIVLEFVKVRFERKIEEPPAPAPAFL